MHALRRGWRSGLSGIYLTFQNYILSIISAWTVKPKLVLLQLLTIHLFIFEKSRLKDFFKSAQLLETKSPPLYDPKDSISFKYSFTIQPLPFCNTNIAMIQPTAFSYMFYKTFVGELTGLYQSPLKLIPIQSRFQLPYFNSRPLLISPPPSSHYGVLANTYSTGLNSWFTLFPKRDQDVQVVSRRIYLYSN